MPISVVDDRAALVVIDLQKGFTGLAGVESTACFAHELEYDGVLAIDAMTDTDATDSREGPIT